ncbi:hypothetical protein SDC9_128533 [bioreactor metagenome]|uniref:Uncharacterized protein n=1 Tax=bioreactor metagenome TaxID=1076179 RepID=A0A645CWE6_9ZZZZ
MSSPNHIKKAVPAVSDKATKVTDMKSVLRRYPFNPILKAVACINANTTVPYLVYCAIFFLPSSPSFARASRLGIAIVNNCIIIEALIYGDMFIANIAKFLNAPPEITSKKPSNPPDSINLARASVFIPGTGIKLPNLNITSIKRVNIILFLRSGIFHAFLIVLNTLNHLYLSS